jgi:ATP-dependent Lhr-like helicase
MWWMVSAFVENIVAGKFREQVPQPLARSLWVRQNRAEIGAIPDMARSL